jgi:hypothetical protein
MVRDILLVSYGISLFNVFDLCGLVVGKQQISVSPELFNCILKSILALICCVLPYLGKNFRFS